MKNSQKKFNILIKINQNPSNIENYMLNFFLYFLLSVSFIDCKLYYVYAHIRHGARYSLTEIYDGIQSKPLWGQTTPSGMRQSERLGSLLRKQYIDDLLFLSQHYDSSQINARETMTNRTFTSMLSFLYGLYPPGTGPRLSNTNFGRNLPPYSNRTDAEQKSYALPYGFQPISIRNLINLNFYDCPQLSSIYKKFYKLGQGDFKRLRRYQKAFFSQISQMFNISTDGLNFTNTKNYFDAVTIDNSLGRPLPSKFSSEHYRLLKLFANWYYHMLTSGKSYFILNTISYLPIIDELDRKIKNPHSKNKATFVNNHETYMIPMSSAFNITSKKCIEELIKYNKTSDIQCEIDYMQFASSIIYELHSNDQKNFFIKIRSNGRYAKICEKQKTECDYDQFKSIVKNNVDIKHFQQFCGLPFNKKQKQSPRKLKKSRHLLHFLTFIKQKFRSELKNEFL